MRVFALHIDFENVRDWTLHLGFKVNQNSLKYRGRSFIPGQNLNFMTYERVWWWNWWAAWMPQHLKHCEMMCDRSSSNRVLSHPDLDLKSLSMAFVICSCRWYSAVTVMSFRLVAAKKGGVLINNLNLINRKIFFDVFFRTLKLGVWVFQPASNSSVTQAARG